MAQSLILPPPRRNKSDKQAKVLLKELCKIAETEDFIAVEDLIERQLIKANNRNQILDFLRKYPNIFEVTEDTCDEFPLWSVRPKTDVKLCDVHSQSAGSCTDPFCMDLHICKFYLLGKDGCKRPNIGRKSCHFIHDLRSNHNLRILQENLLDELTDEELFFIFNDSAQGKKPTSGSGQGPVTCYFYNAGPKGCTKGAQCPFLHMCAHFIAGNCKFNTGCKRSHSFYDPQPSGILAKFGLDPNQARISDIIKTLQKSLAAAGVQPKSPTSPYGGARPKHAGPQALFGMNMPIAMPTHGSATTRFTGPQALSGTRMPLAMTPGHRSTTHLQDGNGQPEFCSYFLKEKCRFGDACFNFHPSSGLPYQWQLKSSDGDQWSDVDKDVNSQLEKEYCDQEISSFKFKTSRGVQYSVGFDSMLLLMGPSNSQIRRLGTKSNMEDGQENNSLATEWKWSWKDNDGSWKPYGSKAQHGAANVSSRDLEKKYLTNQAEKFGFATDSFTYTMDFTLMEQSNDSLGTKRLVRRRPVFVTAETLKQNIKLGAERARRQASVEDIMPKTWEAQSPSSEYSKVQLDRTGNTAAEFKEIESFVQKTIGSTVSRLFGGVKAIYRIQNLELLEKFESKKKWMMKKSSSPGASLERRLFHGTRQKHVDAICQQGFDWRVSGLSTGTRFGKGSYFAVNASYSKAYTDSGELFVVRVLTGDYAKGDSSYTRPPPKSPTNPAMLFDSCVDDTSKPTMFIIFDLAQAYPEYVVEL